MRARRPRLTRAKPGPRWETPDPPNWTGSYGPDIAEWSKQRLGIELGGWQRHVLDRALRYDADYNLIHRVALISTGRQNGKSVLVRALLDWLLVEGRKLNHASPFQHWTEILAAAHDAGQARLIYRAVGSDLRSLPEAQPIPADEHKVKRERPDIVVTDLVGIRAGKLRFDVVTARPGSSRGHSAGAIAWDEVLTQREWDLWEALSPTQTAQRSPIMLLTSTAGHSDSVVLRTFYDRLVRQASGDEKPDPAFYGAWWQSRDPDAGLDWRQIRQANPALNDGRLSRDLIRTEHGILPPDSWRRERLNHFVDRVADAAFAPGKWAACRMRNPLKGLTGPYALGVDVAPDWTRATIAVAAIRADGRIGVEVARDIRDKPGSPITAARLTYELERIKANPAVIAYDQVSGAAAALERHGDETGLPYDKLKPGAVISACMDVSEMILSGRLAVDDPLLDAQVGIVVKRPVGSEGAFRFSRHASGEPIDAIMAMTFAAHAIAWLAPEPRIS